jgi:hypothetical protein
MRCSRSFTLMAQRTMSLRSYCATRTKAPAHAVHARIETTMRYVHMNDARSKNVLKKFWEAQGGHKSGHSAQNEEKPLPVKKRLNPAEQRWLGW